MEDIAQKKPSRSTSPKPWFHGREQYLARGRMRMYVISTIAPCTKENDAQKLKPCAGI
jgi:hypothetical protein